MDQKDKNNPEKDNLLKSYKYRLYPTKTQEDLMDKCFTASREFYNTALEDRTIKFYSALTGEAVTYKDIDEKCRKLLVAKICSKQDNKKEIAQEFFELSNKDLIKDKEAIKKQTQDGTLYTNLYEKLGNEDQRKIIGLVLRILYKSDNNSSGLGENCVSEVADNLEKLISMKTVEQEFYVYYKNLNPEYQGLNADYKKALSDSDNKKKIARELITLFLKKRRREDPKELNNIKEEIKKKHREIKKNYINIKINEYVKKLIEEQIKNKTLYTCLLYTSLIVRSYDCSKSLAGLILNWSIWAVFLPALPPFRCIVMRPIFIVPLFVISIAPSLKKSMHSSIDFNAHRLVVSNFCMTSIQAVANWPLFSTSL